jgi:4-amino-4-deoxy-L-arabinose transferase-like glycosyltransferase/Flp pilus assembly protein TadD
MPESEAGAPASLSSESPVVVELESQEPDASVWLEDFAICGTIVLFAFILRLIYMLQWQRNPMFDHPGMDELYHDQWAQAIAAGKAFVEGPYFRAPLYPAFLGLVYKLFGHSYMAARMAQAALDSLSCGLLFIAGRQVFSRRVAAVAGLAAASYWMLIFFTGELLIAPLIVFFDVLLICLLLRSAKKPGALIYGLAGLVMGISAVARPNILLFAPAVVLWMVIRHWGQLRRSLIYIACVAVGCLLPILPVTIRNYVVGHDRVLIASQGGVNFYIGNNPWSDGRTAIVPGTPGGWWEGYYGSIALAERAEGRKLKPSGVSGYYYRQAWKFITEQPGRALSLLALKLSLFWSSWEIPNDKGIYFWTAHFALIVRYLPLGFGVVGPLGILGLVLCWRRGRELFPLWGFVLVYMAGMVVFFCNARYRMPIIPPLILLGTWSVFETVRVAREQRWLAVGGRAAILVAAGIFVNVTPGSGNFRTDADDWFFLAMEYESQGRGTPALRCYERSLQVRPDFLMARLRYGNLLMAAHRVPDAIKNFRLALESPPRLATNESQATLAQVHATLGAALAETGSFAEAVTEFQAAIPALPPERSARVQLNLGRALATLGRNSEAIEAFEQVLRSDPGNARAEDELRKLGAHP